MRRLLITAALVATAASARADIAPPLPGPAEGTWHGSLRQTNIDGEESYPMTLIMTRRGGTTDYPKLKCGGQLTRLGSDGGYAIYKESITRGAFDSKKGSGCVDGIVVIHTEDDQIVLGWFGAFDGKPITGAGTLTRGQFNSR